MRSADLVTIFNRTQAIRRRQYFIHRRFVMAKRESGPQLEAQASLAFNNAIDYLSCILQVKHENTFLEHETADMIGPDRQSILKAELLEVIGCAQAELASGALFCAKRDDIVIGETQKF